MKESVTGTGEGAEVLAPGPARAHGRLQALMCGFGGLEIGSGGSVRRTGVLPSQWKRLEIRGAGPRRRNYEVR